jgi:uncharacterized lipoprotein YmbA
MMVPAASRPVFLVLVSGLGVLCGCARSSPSRFYILTSETGQRAAARAELGNDDPAFVIALGDFPEYLDRPEIVTRHGAHRVGLATFDRWAEPLKDRFPRVLAENLSTLLATQRITVVPHHATTLQPRRVPVDVLQFDGVLGGDVTLVARWSLLGPDGLEQVPVRRSTLVVPTTREDYEGIAAAMSEAVAALGREMAEAIRTAG